MKQQTIYDNITKWFHLPKTLEVNNGEIFYFNLKTTTYIPEVYHGSPADQPLEKDIPILETIMASGFMLDSRGVDIVKVHRIPSNMMLEPPRIFPGKFSIKLHSMDNSSQQFLRKYYRLVVVYYSKIDSQVSQPSLVGG